LHPLGNDPDQRRDRQTGLGDCDGDQLCEHAEHALAVGGDHRPALVAIEEPSMHEVGLAGLGHHSDEIPILASCGREAC